MKRLKLAGLIFFLFCLWAEILIFVFSLLISNFFWWIFSLLARRFWEGWFYLLSQKTADSFRLAVLLGLMSAFQSLMTDFLSRKTPKKLTLLIYILNAAWISCFFINSIISGTHFSAYPSLWAASLFSLAIGSWELIIHNKKIFFSPFGRGKN